MVVTKEVGLGNSVGYGEDVAGDCLGVRLSFYEIRRHCDYLRMSTQDEADQSGKTGRLSSGIESSRWGS